VKPSGPTPLENDVVLLVLVDVKEVMESGPAEELVDVVVCARAGPATITKNDHQGRATCLRLSVMTAGDRAQDKGASRLRSKSVCGRCGREADPTGGELGPEIDIHRLSTADRETAIVMP